MSNKKQSCGIIYKIINILENKVYIGKSKRSFEQRYSSGKWWKFTHNKQLISDYHRLGHDNFAFEICETNKIDPELTLLEAKYILICNSLQPNGYNCFIEYNGRKSFSDITKNRMSIGQIKRNKENPPQRGWHHTEEARKKIGESTIKMFSKFTEDQRKNRVRNALKGKNHPCWGKKMTEDEKLLRKKPNLKNSSPVLQIDPNTNDIINQFPSIKNAQQILKINNISAVCRGIRFLAGGFKWKYKNEIT